MPLKSHKLLALSALLALAAQNASAFTPNNLSSSQKFTTNTNTALKLATETEIDVSIDYDAAAKLAYDQWRKEYNKGDFDATRFESFKSNYVALTVANVKAAKKARDDGLGSDTVQKLELNDFADMSADEYRAAMGGGDAEVAPAPAPAPAPAAEEPVEDIDVSIAYDGAARIAYDAWREQFNKGEAVETKYAVFKDNYEAVAVANVSAKKAARDKGEDASKVEMIGLPEDADSVVVDIPVSNTNGSATVMETAMDQLAAQDAAASAISQAADAIALEEQVCNKQTKNKNIEHKNKQSNTTHEEKSGTNERMDEPSSENTILVGSIMTRAVHVQKIERCSCLYDWNIRHMR